MTTATMTAATTTKGGRCRVLVTPERGVQIGELLINGHHYLCQRTETGYRLCGKVDRRGDPVVYDLPADCSACDCPDGTYRNREGGCKHARALRALVAAGKLD